jgi:hypothetical protein
MTPAQGSLPQLRAATDPRARSGELYAPRFVSMGDPVRVPVTPWSSNASAGERLWAISERETGIAFDVEELSRTT